MKNDLKFRLNITGIALILCGAIWSTAQMNDMGVRRITAIVGIPASALGLVLIFLSFVLKDRQK